MLPKKHPHFTTISASIYNHKNFVESINKCVANSQPAKLPNGCPALHQKQLTFFFGLFCFFVFNIIIFLPCFGMWQWIGSMSSLLLHHGSIIWPTMNEVVGVCAGGPNIAKQKWSQLLTIPSQFYQLEPLDKIEKQNNLTTGSLMIWWTL